MKYYLIVCILCPLINGQNNPNITTEGNTRFIGALYRNPLDWASQGNSKNTSQCSFYLFIPALSTASNAFTLGLETGNEWFNYGIDTANQWVNAVLSPPNSSKYTNLI